MNALKIAVECAAALAAHVLNGQQPLRLVRVFGSPLLKR